MTPVVPLQNRYRFISVYSIPYTISDRGWVGSNLVLTPEGPIFWGGEMETRDGLTSQCSWNRIKMLWVLWEHQRPLAHHQPGTGWRG